VYQRGKDFVVTSADSCAGNKDDRYRILGELEQLYAGSAVETSFVQEKVWLASDKVLRMALLGRGLINSLPAFPHHRVLELWLESWKSQRLVLCTPADALQVSLDGHRLRAFDAVQSRAFKIVREASRYGEGTRHEVHVRQNILPGSGMPYPVIHAMEQKDSYLFVEEDLVLGRAWNVHRDHWRLRETIVAPLMRLYEHYGISQKPLCAVLKPSVLDALSNLDGSLPLIRHLRALVERNPLVATSLCHGDVIGSNLAVTRTGVVFLDWEKARDYIIGSDLVDLALKHPRYRAFRGAAVRMFEQVQGSGLRFADGVALHFLETRQMQRPIGQSSPENG